MSKRIICFIGMFFCSCVVYGEETYWNVYDDTSGSFSVTSVSCESGGDITTPESPYKYGYRFVGWQPAESFDMSTLDGTETSSSFSYNGRMWFVGFSFGVVFGQSLCSSTTRAEFGTGVLNTTQESGGQCYCRGLGIVPSGTNTAYVNMSKWRFGKETYYNTVSRCIPGGSEDCSKYCADNVKANGFVYVYGE